MSHPATEAVLWEPRDQQVTQCNLCNFRCRVAEGKMGMCQVRRNHQGCLYSLNYHAICAANVDPIEKKPLFHFQPGNRSFSIAAVGCNFRCDFCQNWQISQLPRSQEIPVGTSDPEQIVAAAQKNHCASIAYTYTEPTVFMELAADCGRLAREQGLANVFVSNGYMTIEALDFASSFLDAINVDLKAFSADFYRDVCKASLEPVLQTLRHIAQNTDIWLEVTTLIVPQVNDSAAEIKKIAEFIANELGPHVPWHISRFHPDFQRTVGSATPCETLAGAYELGKRAGLHYVYVGNLHDNQWENTYCHQCGQLLIERLGYRIRQTRLTDGNCLDCGSPMAGGKLTTV